MDEELLKDYELLLPSELKEELLRNRHNLAINLEARTERGNNFFDQAPYGLIRELVRRFPHRIDDVSKIVLDAMQRRDKLSKTMDVSHLPNQPKDILREVLDILPKDVEDFLVTQPEAEPKEKHFAAEIIRFFEKLKRGSIVLFDMDHTLGDGIQWKTRPVAKSLLQFLRMKFPTIRIGILSDRQYTLDAGDGLRQIIERDENFSESVFENGLVFSSRGGKVNGQTYEDYFGMKRPKGKAGRGELTQQKENLMDTLSQRERTSVFLIDDSRMFGGEMEAGRVLVVPSWSEYSQFTPQPDHKSY